MTSEIHYLALVCVATSVMWVPYILNSMVVRGIWATLQNPRTDAPPLSPWAERAKRAHYNAVENLVVFAALLLAAAAAEVSSEVTVAAAAIYFWARVAHYVIYAAGIPVLRTLSFLAGCGCQLAIGFELLS